MLDIFAQSLGVVFSLTNLIMIVFGVFIGMLMGAIPGLTGIMAIALLLPFTFTMHPVTALILLIGVFKGAMFGGSIPSILMNIPGAPPSAATALDGYPLALQGKSQKALKIALYASVMGDVFSDLVLITVAGYLAGIALKFGPPEYSMLIVFSLTTIGAVSGETLIKGLLSAAGGLFLATVGLDPVTGSPRFFFGFVELYDGFSLLPLLIGLFALSEILRQLEGKIEGLAKADFLPLSGKPEDQKVTKEDMKRSIIPIFRGSALGTLIGAIPGIGPTVGAFMSYAETRRSSKNPSLFGKGAVEGVAAAESANSAVCGANMIPLLALGIPGDAVAAILMGAFMIQGLAPGPLIFQTHLDIVYGFFIALILANIANLLVGLVAIRFSRRLTKISKVMILPIVLILCFAGSYAINASLFDVKVTFLFGVLGYLMTKFGFPTAPMLIGFILGPMAELAIRQSLIISHGSVLIFFTRPIALAFIIITIATIIYTSIKNSRKS
jgi:putative tricarboxylic transport membrane protein